MARRKHTPSRPAHSGKGGSPSAIPTTKQSAPPGNVSPSGPVSPSSDDPSSLRHIPLDRPTPSHAGRFSVILAEWLRYATDDAVPLHPIAILLGLATGWQFLATRTMLAGPIDSSSSTGIMIGTIALLAAAAGSRLPERTLRGLAGFIRRHWQPDESSPEYAAGTFWILRASPGRDEPLMWLSLSVLSASAGAASLLTLLLVGPFETLYSFMLQRFFWTNLTLTALEWTGVTLLIALPWVACGLVLAILTPVVNTHPRGRRHATGLTAGIVLGLALAFLVHETWIFWGISGRREYLMGVLPMFLLAALSARRSQKADLLAGLPAPIQPEGPEISSGAEGLVWSALIVWGISSVLVVTGWLTCGQVVDGPWHRADTRMGWLTLTTAVGMISACFHTRRTTRSASGCGMAAWVAGLGAGAMATLVSIWPDHIFAEIAQTLVFGLSFGYALHYTERAWLAHAGSTTVGFAQLAGALLAGLAVGLASAFWCALPLLGPVGTMTAGALLMLAFGGLLQIYEQHRPARTQHQRLALIFTSLACAIVLFPADTKHWSQWRRRQFAATAPTNNLDWLDHRPLTVAERLCLVGISPSVTKAPVLGTARADIIPFNTEPWRRRISPEFHDHSFKILSQNAFRALRLENTSYNLIYQTDQAFRDCRGCPGYSLEWLTELASRTIAGGSVYIDVPLADIPPEALMVIAATFRHAMETPARWALVDDEHGGHLRLVAGPGPAKEANQNSGLTWSPVDLLLVGNSNPPLHSLQRDRLTTLVRTQSRNRQVELTRWLARCRSTPLSTSQRRID